MSPSPFRLGAALAAAAFIGGVGATAANAAFDDVDERSPFGEQIQNVQEAGIATGFPDGSFRPTEDLTRQQAAAWLSRSTTRVGLDILLDEDGNPAGELLTPADPTNTIAQVAISSPAASTGGGWVVIQGSAGGTVPATSLGNCPCGVDLVVRNGADEIVGRGALTMLGSAGDDERAYIGGITTSPILAVIPLAGGASDTFTLEATLVDRDGEVYLGAAMFGSYVAMADGAPDQWTGESAPDATDGVESVVPDIVFGSS